MRWLREQYRETGSYFRRMLVGPLLGCSLLMIVVVVLIWQLLIRNPQALEQALQGIFAIFEQKSIVIDGKVSGLLLLANNLVAIALLIVLGMIPMLFLPLWSLGINAGIIGAMGAIYSVMFENPTVFWAGILPHGIFEIPAMLLAAASGMRLSLWMLQTILGKRPSVSFGQILMESARFYVLVLAPLLLTAAVIEAYLTPLFMTWAAG